MNNSDISDRIIDQFSDRSDRADIWRVLDLVVPTDQFLNLGYSRWYQTHIFGSPQRRLVEIVANELEKREVPRSSSPLLDIGCGRGGAAHVVADAFEIDVVGLDLVPYNVATAIHWQSANSLTFIIGNASTMPFSSATFSACIAIDSIVYMPNKHDVFLEISRVLKPTGICVISDLFVANKSTIDDNVLHRFEDAWDFPTLWGVDAYRTAIETAGLSVLDVSDLTRASIRRFRKWTTLFLLVADGPLGPLLRRLLSRRGLDADVVVDQIRAAHNALPGLQHAMLTIENSPTIDE